MTAARLAKPARAKSSRALPHAFFVTDPIRTPDPLKVIRHLPPGFGVIWRHFGESTRLAAGLAIARACHKHGLVLLVASDPQLAQRIGAAGVHWPERQLRGVRARHPRHLETASAHSRAAIARARQRGVDALLLSAVFPSRSPSAGAPLGAMRFNLLALASPLPVYALGGVGPENAQSVMRHAAGWAAIEAVVEAWGQA
jgi:thiamine-phosphate pyrophosphorylase